MASDLLVIANSGISAAQIAINTTGQNISNVSSIGYSREQVTQTTNPTGQGTDIQSITRIYNEFLAQQANNAQTKSSELDTQYQQIQPINNIIADPNVGISAAVSNFFNSLQSVANQPGDLTSRQVSIASAQNLASSFNQLQNTLDNINTNINNQLTQSVQTINSLASQIVTINKQIVGTTDGATVNGLNDQRDALVTELSKQVRITVTQQSGSDIISIANGIPIVDASTSYPLSIITSASNNSQVDVSYNSSNTGSVLGPQNMAGGVLGGLINFRSSTLSQVQNGIGRVALGLATGINGAQANGYTLDGKVGKDLISTGNLYSYSNANNKGKGVINAVLATPFDTSKITTSNYSIQFDGTNYTLRRDSDNVALSTNTNGVFNNIDGMNISIQGIPADGDKFTLSPTANAARGFSVLTSDPNAIAAASQSNYSPSASGALVTISPDDNSNMYNLLNVQTKNILLNGNLQDAFSQVVSTLGNQANQLKTTSAFEDQVQQNASQALQNVRGVNLDEEAANLIKYQQAYQASGKVMQIAKQMFDTLMTLSQ